MCFAGFVFACFVFASVFISEEGEPSRVCQAPVSMQAIISSAPLKSMYVCGERARAQCPSQRLMRGWRPSPTYTSVA